MSENPQLDRYKKLLSYIDEHLDEPINIQKVEEVCHYSYRNINRIFEAIHEETIGKYVKRLRLEKAAHYLKYSDIGVTQIAYEVGFEDRTAFSKAFKKKYNHSPQSFRESSESLRLEAQKHLWREEDGPREALSYKIEYLPDFDYLFLEYRGDFRNTTSMDEHWQQLIDYADEKTLLSEQSIFMTEIIDDESVSDQIHSRYHLALLLEKPLDFKPQQLFRSRKHKRQKYARFTHQGSVESSADFYHQLFAFWMLDIRLELADLPILEFYPNYWEQLPEDELITEIYIPVQ